MTTTEELVERIMQLKAERKRCFDVEGDDVDTLFSEAAARLTLLEAQNRELRDALKETTDFLEEAISNRMFTIGEMLACEIVDRNFALLNAHPDDPATPKEIEA